jgi:hypothetical protein
MRELKEKAQAQKMEKEEREGVSIEARYWVGVNALHF